MWEYKKRLEYPVKIKNPNPALAKVIISQLGGASCICYNLLSSSSCLIFCSR